MIIAFPAKAGTPQSAPESVEEWVLAFAGKAVLKGGEKHG